MDDPKPSLSNAKNGLNIKILGIFSLLRLKFLRKNVLRIIIDVLHVMLVLIIRQLIMDHHYKKFVHEFKKKPVKKKFYS